MHILYLDPCAQPGGAERCLLDMLASLRHCEPKWRLSLITGESGPLLADARHLGVEAYAVPLPDELARLGSFGSGRLQLAWDCLKAVPAAAQYRTRLRHAMQRIGPDIVHSNGFKMHVLGGDCTPASSIWHLHDYPSGRAAATRGLRAVAHHCKGMVAISGSVAADAREVFGPRATVRTILNAVDLDRFHPEGEQADLDTLSGMKPAGPGVTRVGLVSTFARWKGHEVFLRALASDELRHRHIRGYIVGGPIYQTTDSQYSFEELRVLAKQLGIADRVGFTRFVAEPAAAMRALDVVVHASTQREPFGLAIAEAMACGRATIAANAGGAAELFENGVSAWGTAPGDVAALADAIAALSCDAGLRARLGTAARTTAEARFNRDRLGPAMASFYSEVVHSCAYSTSTAAISTAA